MAAAEMEAGAPGATKPAPEPVRVKKMPGRNDPCWCGSGKKYKQCHMKADLAGGNGGAASAVAGKSQAGKKPAQARPRRR